MRTSRTLSYFRARSRLTLDRPGCTCGCAPLPSWLCRRLRRRPRPTCDGARRVCFLARPMAEARVACASDGLASAYPRLPRLASTLADRCHRTVLHLSSGGGARATHTSSGSACKSSADRHHNLHKNLQNGYTHASVHLEPVSVPKPTGRLRAVLLSSTACRLHFSCITKIRPAARQRMSDSHVPCIVRPLGERARAAHRAADRTHVHTFLAGHVPGPSPPTTGPPVPAL